MSSTSGLRAGILIIGSLLWDLKKLDRGRWQYERLDMAAKEPFHAPLRYGRLSTGGERQGQYTMTLSGTAGPGIGYAVPCKRAVSTIADLEAEVHALAIAEGLVDSYGAARWKTFGAVGVAFRDPAAGVVPRLAELWGQSFGFRCNLATTLWETYRQLDETPPVSHDGVLTIGWPAGADSGEPLAFDLLLATATEPSPIGRRYASADEIAESLVYHAGNADYFRGNVLNGIRTQDDAAIWSALEAKAPAWLRTERYAQLEVRMREPLAFGSR
jgi:hypothetical protein